MRDYYRTPWSLGYDNAEEFQEHERTPGKRSLTESLPPRGASDAFDSAMRDGRSGVPFQSEMERAYGLSLDGVVSATGRLDEMFELGAVAATQGNRIAFGDESPSKAVVAHEVAHVVQNRNAGASAAIAAKGDVASSGHAAEIEADAAAERVLRGESVSIREAPSGGIHRIGGKEIAKLARSFAQGDDNLYECLKGTFKKHMKKEQRSLEDYSEVEVEKLFSKWTMRYHEIVEEKKQEALLRKKKKQEKQKEVKKDEEQVDEPQIKQAKPQRNPEPENEPTEVEGEYTNVNQCLKFCWNFANGDNEYEMFLREEVANAIKEKSPLPRDDLFQVLFRAENRFRAQKGATKEEIKGKVGFHRMQGGSVDVELPEEVDEKVNLWQGNHAKQGSEDWATEEQGDLYLDLLAKSQPEFLNDADYSYDGDKSNPATSNCSIMALSGVLAVSGSSIMTSLGRQGGAQYDSTFQPHSELGLQGGHESQMDGLIAFAKRFVSPRLKIEDPCKQSIDEERGKYEVSAGIEAMKEYPPGTQFVVYLDPGHFVYAERRSGGIKFIDHQTAMKETPRNKTLAKKDPNVSVDVPPPMPFVEDPSQWHAIQFIAFVPDKTLVEDVIDKGPSEHNALK